jgi:hypothetical protein
MDGSFQLDFRDVELFGSIQKNISGYTVIPKPPGDAFGHFFSSAVRTA